MPNRSIAVSPMRYVHPDGQSLTEQEFARYRRFRTDLGEYRRAGNVLYLFRGEERRQLRKMLARQGEQIADADLYDRLYMFGAKARHFFLGDPHNIDERAYFRTINDTGVASLEHLFERIANVLRDDRTRAEAEQHCSKAFRDYFQDPGRRDEFVLRIQRQTDVMQLRLRDYYLFFLHTAGAAGIRNESFLVSTSVSRRTALMVFAHRRRSRVIEYFVPQPYYNFVVAPWLCDEAHRRAYMLHLPTFQPHGIFPHQQEVAVKGALLPHFILGVGDWEQRSFVPNPHIYATEQLNLRDVMKRGIPVDQSQFAATVFSTGYHRYGATDGDGNFFEVPIPMPDAPTA